MKIIIIILICILFITLILLIKDYCVEYSNSQNTFNSNSLDPVYSSLYAEDIKLLPHLYMINLRDREDRLDKTLNYLSQLDYPKEKIHRIDAVRNTENGHKGCLESHIKALKIAKEHKDNIPYSMIIEDDIFFVKDKHTVIHTIATTIKNNDWNVLLFDCERLTEGGRITKEKKERSKSNSLKGGCQTTTGYIIKKSYINTLLSIWEPTVGIDNWENGKHACDQSWKIIQDITWIVITPRLVSQGPDFSNIENKFLNKKIKQNWTNSSNNLPEEIKPAQNKMTFMLSVFDQICKKHNIKYWLSFGTLLGSVRHKGWIEWDGDMDVGMLYSDYYKFRYIIEKELPKNLWLQDIISDELYKERDLPKIRDLNSCYIQYTNTNKHGKTHHNGLQLDIFLYKKQGNNLIYTEPRKDMKYNTSDIFPLKLGLFENLSLYIPYNSHNILKQSYGDYMKLPPKSERFPHEGEMWSTRTCPHHIDLYQDLYLPFKQQISSEKTPRICWIFWFNTRKPTPTRQKLIENMRKTIGVELKLITCENIHNYLKYPIHPAVPYLSGNHKSDYFRVYFLLHYGGAYYDIKNVSENFSKFFDLLDNDNTITVIGSPEMIDKYPRKKWNKYCIENGGFIARPNSDYMKEFQELQHKILDKHYKVLKNRSKRGLAPPQREHDSKWDPYPLKWEELCGDIHYIFGVKYRNNISRIMKNIDVGTNYGRNETRPSDSKKDRTEEQIWVEEGFLIPYVYSIENDITIE